MIQRLSDPPGALDVVGGKAQSLQRMTAAGLHVPAGFVLPVDFFSAWLASLAPRFDALAADDVSAACAALQADAAALTLTPAMTQALDAVLGDFDGALFAVRSSSPEEDLAGASFAGGYETVLGVDAAGLPQAIARAFASCLGERVIVYKRAQGLDPSKPRIAVVVQRMVHADVAGVAFSISPLTNDYDEVVINASPGLGETVVSGQVTPDAFVVDKRDGRIVEQSLGLREVALFLESDGSLREEHDLDVVGPCLTADQLAALTEQVCGIEALYDCPMDIEWAFENGALKLLQARPVTTWFPLHPDFVSKPDEPRQIYIDFSLIEQGLPEPMSVFGTSIYDWCMKSIDSVILDQPVDEVDNAHLGKVSRGGRCYMNACGSMEGFPGFIDIVRSLDPETADIIGTIDFSKHPYWSPGMPLWKLLLTKAPGMLVKAVHSVLRPEAVSRADDVWTADFEQRLAAGLSTGSLRERVVLAFDRHGLMSPGLATMIVPLALGRMAVTRIEGLVEQVGGSFELGQRIVGALPGNPTLDLGIRLETLGRALPQGCWDEATLVQAVSARTLPEPWLADWDALVAAYGCRGPREIDAGNKRYRETPELWLAQVLTLRELAPEDGPTLRYQRTQEGRDAAAAELRALLPWWKRPYFGRLYRIAKAFGGKRETPKYVMVQVIDRMRARALEVGADWVVAGRLDDLGQVFDLRAEDIFVGVEDPSADLRAIGRANRVLPDQLRALPSLPKVVDSRGRIYRAPPSDVGADGLVGTSICAGTVRGTVRVLQAAEEGLDAGDVLVTRATDPGWTPLFPAAAAILLEVGGTLQHGALVAREYGIPCVVGLRNVTRRLQDGMVVEVDGGAGTVRIVDNGSA